MPIERDWLPKYERGRDGKGCSFYFRAQRPDRKLQFCMIYVMFHIHIDYTMTRAKPDASIEKFYRADFPIGASNKATLRTSSRVSQKLFNWFSTKLTPTTFEQAT